ncbi:hypothetical protein KAW08_03680 [bacterium]|nr:hypothetical protein [bacterium]
MEKKRPSIITILCIILLIGVVLRIPRIFSAIVRPTGNWYPPYLAFSYVIGLVCMVGLWMMKKWGIVLYTASFALGQIVLLATGIWNIGTLIIPLIVIAIGFSQFSKMK